MNKVKYPLRSLLLYLKLDQETADLLASVAAQDLRDVKNEALILLREALRARGY